MMGYVLLIYYIIWNYIYVDSCKISPKYKQTNLFQVPEEINFSMHLAAIPAAEPIIRILALSIYLYKIRTTIEISLEEYFLVTRNIALDC
jgi:hypothetical protein